MITDIYKTMIENSPISHLHIKLIEDENGNYTNLEVISYNKSYERIFLIEANIKIEDINNLPDTEEEMNKWKNIFSIVKRDKKYTCKKYVEYMNMYFNIDIFHGGENEFHVRFDSISENDLKLSPMLKKAPFISWIKDRNGVYLDVNYTYLNHFNKQYKDIIGKTDYDIWTKEMADSFLKEDEEAIKLNTLCSYEESFAHETGNIHINHYEKCKWPYMNKDNTVVVGTMGVCVEKTETLELRKKIEENEKRFLEIVENIRDIIIIRDEKKAEYVNKAFEKVYGFKPNALYEDINAWHEHWDEIEFEEQPSDYNCTEIDTNIFRVSKKGQEDRWMWSRFVPILDEYGNLIKKIGILSDITESKKNQLEIDKMKIDFFANLSHELRTPINLIMSSLQVIYLKLDKLDPEMHEYFNKYLNIVTQNGRRLLKLVNNLIDTTRLDAGCFEYSPKNRDIVRCVEDICLSVSEFVKDNNMNITFDTNVEEKVIGFDQDNMERIILNLVSNAIKFNKPNGDIFVNLEYDKDIKISVKDTGIGIPKDKLESIFGRFEQVKSKLKKEKEGSGIGLSLVKSLVEIHGGNITVDSKLGEGSEFIVTLPNGLVNEDKQEENNAQMYLSNINLMNVEFSDI
ncbi:MAG: PAS domain-containing sensor histidine kinase, partial [Paraclostridium sp.]